MSLNPKKLVGEIYTAIDKAEKKIRWDFLLSYRIDGTGARAAIQRVLKKNRLTKASADEVYLLLQVSFRDDGLDDDLFAALLTRYLKYVGQDEAASKPRRTANKRLTAF